MKNDNGGPGKRTPFTPKPINTNFGTPPAHKQQQWDLAKQKHVTPEPVAELMKEIRAVAKQLIAAGVTAEEIRATVGKIAVVDRFVDLDVLSVQKLVEIKQALNARKKKICQIK